MDAPTWRGEDSAADPLRLQRAPKETRPSRAQLRPGLEVPLRRLIRPPEMRCSGEQFLEGNRDLEPTRGSDKSVLCERGRARGMKQVCSRCVQQPTCVKCRSPTAAPPIRRSGRKRRVMARLCCLKVSRLGRSPESLWAHPLGGGRNRFSRPLKPSLQNGGEAPVRSLARFSPWAALTGRPGCLVAAPYANVQP